MRTIIDVRSWNRRYVQLLADGRTRTLAAAATAAIVLAGAFGTEWAVRHSLAGAALGLPPGVRLTYESVSYAVGGLHLDGVRVSDLSDGIVLEVPQMDLGGVGIATLLGSAQPIDLTLRDPRITLFAERSVTGWRSLSALPRWNRWRAGLRLRVRSGSVSSQTQSLAPNDFTLQDVNGNLALGPQGRLSYTIDAMCTGAGSADPLRGEADAGDDGATVQRWTASTFPLRAVLEELGTAPALVARGGTLRDATLTYRDDSTGAAGDPQLKITAHLEDGDLQIASNAHEIRGLHGALTVVDDGIGSPLLAGTIDGVPLEVAGEVEDRRGPHFGWLGDGSEDLRSLLDLGSKVAAQDRVRSLRLEAVAPGIAFAQYATSLSYGPLVATVMSVDPKEPTIHFNAVLANDHVTSGGERVSAMAQRTGAIAGINGDYYDIGGSWGPQGVEVRSGVLLRTPTERMALAIHRDNRVTFAEFRLHGTVSIGARKLPLTQLNSWPVGDVTLMTPEFGNIPPAKGVTLAEIVPIDAKAGEFRVVRVAAADTEFEPTYALAFGPLVRAQLRSGDLVRVDYGLTPWSDDIVTAIGGGPLLLRNGAWYEDPHAPAPDEREAHWAVVAVGRLSDDRVMIFQVDGRHPERSVGITRPDFAALMRRFGVIDAMALDSGGSSTIVSRAPGEPLATVRNRPSDNDGERWVSNGLFVYSAAPSGTLLKPAAPAATAASRVLAAP